MICTATFDGTAFSSKIFASSPVVTSRFGIAQPLSRYSRSTSETRTQCNFTLNASFTFTAPISFKSSSARSRGVRLSGSGRCFHAMNAAPPTIVSANATEPINGRGELVSCHNSACGLMSRSSWSFSANTDFTSSVTGATKMFCTCPCASATVKFNSGVVTLPGRK